MPPRPLRIAVSADLHWGTRHTAGNQATLQMVEHLRANPPDLLLLAGDIGAGDDFQRCLELFDPLPCRKALVPGNHDIWVRTFDARGDSQRVYEQHLPELCRHHGFTYLDQEPLHLVEHDVAIIGSMNWYDYTWDHDALQAAMPDWEERLRTKRFTRGMHNDANFVRWGTNDVEFTTRLVTQFEQHLQAALQACGQVVVVAHHPPLHGLLYPAQEPLHPDALLWRAFSGNTRMESLICTHADRIPWVFCGHTHRARTWTHATLHGHNVGGDYHFKRLLEIAWPEGHLTEHEFHGAS